jgi:2-polyprenyl-3-methyl-5-hydroxy-6-metoxy-1,4-benzoquinol methylase
MNTKLSIKEKFTNTFKKDLWNMDSGESKSGLGSSLEYTIHFRNNLLRIIKNYNINKIFDCSCGDWNWMKEIKDYLPEYVGNDIVDEIILNNKNKFETDKIYFVSNDMIDEMKKYKDKHFDLVICRYTLEHLNNDYCFNVINEIKRVSNYAIITSTNTITNNLEIENLDGVSYRPINLELTPFSEILGNNIEFFYDSANEAKSNGCFGFLYKF